MKLWESPVRSLRAAAVLSWAVAVAVYFNAAGNGFAQDDNLIVLGNTAIQSLETLPQALAEPYWVGEYAEGRGLWRPLVTAFFGLEWAIFDGNPVGFHVVNILLHAGVTVLVVLLLGEIVPVGAAFLGGLVFAVHPVHVEAVANVVGASEVLSGFFFLLACLVMIRAGDRLGKGRVAAVLTLFLFAFLTKESAITLLGMVLLLDSSKVDLGVRDLGAYMGRRWQLFAGMLAVAGAVLWGRYLVLGTLAKPFPPLGMGLLTEIPRIWTVAGTWPHVIRLLFFPLDLSVDYGPALIPLEFGWRSANLTGLFLVLAVLLSAMVSWRRGVLSPTHLSSRVVGWGVVWFVIALAPTSNLLFLSGLLLSERTLYLPSVGFVAVVAWAGVRLWETRPRLTPVLLGLAVVSLGVRTWTRTPTWRDNQAVFLTLTSQHPEVGRAQWVMGDSHFAAGQTRAGLTAYRVALGTLRGDYNIEVGVARNLMGAGYDRPAEILLSHAWEQRPQYGVAPGLLAQIYEGQGRFPEAEEAARYSLERDSTAAIQHHILSRALQAQGRLREALDSRRTANRHAEAPHFLQWIWLAELQLKLGDTIQAWASLDSARLIAVSLRDRRQIDSVGAAMGTRFR